MKQMMNVRIIDAHTGEHHTEEYPIGDYFGPVDLGLHLSEKYHGLNFGIGLFAGSIFSGSNRLIVTGDSPNWDGFFVSTMGGAGLVFQTMGIDMLVIIHKADTPSLLYLNQKEDGEMEIELAPVALEAVWESGEPNERGIYALMDHILDRYGERYANDPRILAVGPSAQTTDFGAIGSSPIKKGKRSPVDTWAGRGGFGSKMLQEHGIAAIIYGGETPGERFRDRKKADEWFMERYGMGLAAKDKAGTLKYNFDPKLGTGGTLGANFTTLGGSLLSFNYRSVYRTESERLDLNQKYILDHYLVQFNEEIQDKKAHKNCGEPCAVMCKKMNGDYKKDYEPYQAMGPQIGVFDQRAAEQINRHADAQGFDAISIGGVLSWLMECLVEGYMTPEDLGVDALPIFDLTHFDRVESSWHNARLAIGLIDAIIDRHGVLDMRSGVRLLARKLSRTFHPKIVGAFVYTANGDKGWMVPNQYWTPGVVSPMPIMGKYYVYYGQDFVPPYQLGHDNAERFRKELILDNIGMCRFHRAWAEEMIPDLVGYVFGMKEAYLESIGRLAAEINAHNTTHHWESERVLDFVHAFLRRKRDVDQDTRPQLQEWIEAFETDKRAAGFKFWDALRQGMEDNSQPG